MSIRHVPGRRSRPFEKLSAAFAAVLSVRFIVISTVLIIAVWVPPGLLQPTLARANGPMELLQDVFLFVGLLLVLCAMRSTAGAIRTFAAGMALFYVTFLIREVDIRLVTHGLLYSLLNGSFKNLLLTAGLILVAASSLLRTRAVWVELVRWLRNPAGRCVAVAGVPYVLAAIPTSRCWSSMICPRKPSKRAQRGSCSSAPRQPFRYGVPFVRPGEEK